MLLRLERPRLLKPGEPAENMFAGKIAEVVYLGEAIKYRIALDAGFEVLARWPYREAGGAFQLDDRVQVGWGAADMQLVEWS